jgi:nucleotide-binding universal stress UspA family protein
MVRSTVSSTAIGTVLVGVDGSEGAMRARAFAEGLAAQLGAAVVVVHARGLLEAAAAGGTGHATVAGEAPAAALAGAIVVDGEPVDVLLRVAEERRADLLVVGSRGIGGRPELLLGSTSTELAQRSTRPVVVVPASG